MPSPEPQPRTDAVDPIKGAGITPEPLPKIERFASGRSPWAPALGLAVLAGLAAWAVGEAAYKGFNPEFTPPPGFEKMSGYQQRDVRAEFELTTTTPAEAKNTALGFGVLGALLGASLGVAGGLASGTGRVRPAALAVGLLAGLLVGGMVAMIATPLIFPFFEPETSLMLPLLTHASVFAAVGAAAGLAFGLGTGDRASIGPALIGGLLGGVLGTIVFEMINAVAFPQVRLSEPIPGHRFGRLAAYLSVALCVALLAVFAVRDQGRTRRKPAPAPAPLAE